MICVGMWEGNGNSIKFALKDILVCLNTQTEINAMEGIQSSTQFNIDHLGECIELLEQHLKFTKTF